MKGGQPSSVIFGGTRKRKNKMKGGSFAEVGASEFVNSGKLGPIAAHAGVTGQVGASVDAMTITHGGDMNGGRRHRKRKSVKRKRRGTTKRRGSKRKSAKRRSSKRKSRKH